MRAAMHEENHGTCKEAEDEGEACPHQDRGEAQDACEGATAEDWFVKVSPRNGERRAVAQVAAFSFEEAMSLSERDQQYARDGLIPQPVIFTIDTDGNHHFAGGPMAQLPWRTMIDIQAMPHWPWIRIDQKAATVMIALDGRTVVYKRRGVSFNRSQWICDLESQ